MDHLHELDGHDGVFVLRRPVLVAHDGPVQRLPVVDDVVKLVSGKFRGRVLREGLTMVVAAATGVVLDVAAVVVVAH